MEWQLLFHKSLIVKSSEFQNIKIRWRSRYAFTKSWDSANTKRSAIKGILMKNAKISSTADPRRPVTKDIPNYKGVMFWKEVVVIVEDVTTFIRKKTYHQENERKH